MEIQEVWIDIEEYKEKYEKDYPNYQIKINNNIIFYIVDEKLFYLLEDAFEYLDSKGK